MLFASISIIVETEASKCRKFTTNIDVNFSPTGMEMLTLIQKWSSYCWKIDCIKKKAHTWRTWIDLVSNAWIECVLWLFVLFKFWCVYRMPQIHLWSDFFSLHFLSKSAIIRHAYNWWAAMHFHRSSFTITYTCVKRHWIICNNKNARNKTKHSKTRMQNKLETCRSLNRGYFVICCSAVPFFMGCITLIVCTNLRFVGAHNFFFFSHLNFKTAWNCLVSYSARAHTKVWILLHRTGS